MTKRTKHQTQERIEFVVERIGRGLSRTEIIGQLIDKYGVGNSQAKNWYVRGADSLIVLDPNLRPQVRAGLLELLHVQLNGCYLDMDLVKGEMTRVDAWWAERNDLEATLVAGGIDRIDRETEARLRLQLGFIPNLTFKSKTILVIHQGTIRDRIVRICTEIARLHGLYIEEMPWLRAVQVLVENNLLPSGAAENLLRLVQDFTGKVELLSAEVADFEELDLD
jgi:hypothetical protein